MTPDHVRLVRDSFESIRPMAGSLSQLFYGRLFSLDPSLRALFRSDIRLQGEKLMAMLGAVVDSADNLDAMRPQLRELGRAHREYGTRPAHYDSVASALLWSLAQALERDFRPEMKQAWSELVHAVNDEMKQGATEG